MPRAPAPPNCGPTRLRILVVEHQADAGIGLVGERITRAGGALVIVGPETGRSVPWSAEGFDGVVLLGGSPSPDDDTVPWFPMVRTLIRDCLDRQVAFLGICLGSQLLGLVAGGTVAPVRGGPEVGVCSLRPTEAAAADPLLYDLRPEVKALQWHTYEVRDLPQGSQPLLGSPSCANQAFRVGPSAWGVQFHLEALVSTAEAWSDGDGEVLADVGLTSRALLAQMRAAEPTLRATWSEVADRWIAVAAARSFSPGVAQVGRADAAEAGP